MLRMAILLASLFYPLGFAQQSTTTPPTDIDDLADSAPSDVSTVPSASSVEKPLPTTPPRDPCGPLIQSHNVVGSTCNVPLLHAGDNDNSPTAYSVKCRAPLYPSDPNITFSACVERTIPAICNKLIRPNVQKGKWIWASATPPDRCWMGFRLPSYEGSAKRLTSVDECIKNIFTPLVGFCNPGSTPGAYDLGLVNIKLPPDSTQTGIQIDAGYPSYIMATSELTGRD